MQSIDQEQDHLMLDPIMERSMNSISSDYGVNNNDSGEALKLMKMRLGNAKDTLIKIHLKAGDTYTAEERKAADEAQEMVNWFTSQINSMMKKVESNKSRTIDLNEIPKFQLKGQSVHFPNDVKYSSIEHYFSAFENVVHASGNLIEEVWSRYIPVSVPFEYEAWVRNDLIKCESWDQAKDLFRKHYGTPVNTEESLGKLFRMKMKNSDTLQDYTNQFLTHLQNAGCSLKSTLLAKFYRFTLLRKNQQIMMNQMKVMHREDSYPWTINEIYECVLPLFLVEEQAGDESTSQAGDKRGKENTKMKLEDLVQDFTVRDTEVQVQTIILVNVDRSSENL
ncbi:hypothetical protein INT46_006570 [Mucor plumbeus]|uniref:Retrotransposon gag domain-containing protein n=1 Tax=Mucor plumbeus TaxID=97098 RepID=A0A8H7VEH7_9FUNG|nr:hypothetical protein INT46_006570 [Mucor plumbeus]